MQLLRGTQSSRYVIRFSTEKFRLRRAARTFIVELGRTLA